METLKDMKRNASPGPDGFNVEFYIATWSWIGPDVVQLVRSFFQSGIMPSHINDTHIAWIPKKLVPLVPTDYRPISLCNVIYKLIFGLPRSMIDHHVQIFGLPGRRCVIEVGPWLLSQAQNLVVIACTDISRRRPRLSLRPISLLDERFRICWDTPGAAKP
jgi:hypothetical protein